MFTVGVLGCAEAPPPAAEVRPTLAVVVPLSGPREPLGRAALDGVALAAGPELDVLPLDDAPEGALAAALARVADAPGVLGVVAHVDAAAAEAGTEAWIASGLPVVIAAPGEHRGAPRVVPPVDVGARCAADVLDVPFSARTDDSTAGMLGGRALVAAAPVRAVDVDTVDAARLAGQAARLAGRRARLVAWVGDAAAGGNLLRALRKVGSDAAFVGVGAYDARFLTAAGAAAEGARVTSQERAATDPAFLQAWSTRHGGRPSGVAVDAYDAASLLVSAWRVASEGARARGVPLTAEEVRASLRTVVATGASGSMYLDEEGVLQPVSCAVFTVTGGQFRQERFVGGADALLSDPKGGRRR